MRIVEKRLRVHAYAKEVATLYWYKCGYIPSLLVAIVNATTSEEALRKYNHNHDPQNGRFTSGVPDETINDPPIQPVYPVETALGVILGGNAVMAAREALGVAVDVGGASVPDVSIAGADLTGHAVERAVQREISAEEAQGAIQTATDTGNVVNQTGKYGTLQRVYRGTNGVTVVVETTGRNAGKIITLWRH